MPPGLTTWHGNVNLIHVYIEYATKKPDSFNLRVILVYCGYRSYLNEYGVILTD